MTEQVEIARDEETGIRVYAEHDPDAESPITDDEAVIFAVLHRNYTNPAEKHGLTTVEDIAEFERTNAGADSEWIVFSLYMFDHSSTTYKAGMLGEENPFGDGMYARFDSGRVGIIALKRGEFAAPVGEEFDPLKAANGICSTYTDWANGNAWGYVVEDAAGDTLDSCWGFIGDHDEVCFIGEAMDSYNHYLSEARTVIAAELADARPDMHPV